MLKAGVSLCHRCGKTSTGFYYYNGTLNIWVQLKRKSFGGFYVEKYVPENMAVSDESVRLITAKDATLDDLKSVINVAVTSADGKRTESSLFTRVCPHCNQENNIIQDLGIFPTYVVAVIGTRSVGKSSWLRAIATPANISNVNKADHASKNIYKISTSPVDDQGTIGATSVNAEGETRILYIHRTSEKTQRTKEKIRKAVAAVLLVDFAGELFEKENRKLFINSHAYKAFLPAKGYSGVDAVLFMDDITNDQKLTDVYNQIAETKVLERKPVAYVINKIDSYFSNPPTVMLEDGTSAPLFDKNTFPRYADSPYSREKLIPRITLTTHLTKQHRKLAENIIDSNPNSAGFMIKTCHPIRRNPYVFESRAEVENDFTSPINIMDPLIWILNKLDIFPY